MKTALLICMTLASANVAFAQTPPADSTSPSSASSPHQRESTSTTTKETTTPSNPAPSAASSPHQQHVTEGADKTKANEKMMKELCGQAAVDEFNDVARGCEEGVHGSDEDEAGR